MKNDMRKRARVPFGYEIVDGKAIINQAESTKLKLYFELFLSGKSMSAAAKASGKARLKELTRD